MLTLTTWEKYVPDIGNNRSLPKEEQVHLLVERGLSLRQREAFEKEMRDAFEASPETLVHRVSAALSMHVKWGGEPLRWEGGTVTSLEEYAQLVLVELRHQRYVNELLGLVRLANSFGPEAALPFERPSGTAPGTEGLKPPTV